MRILGKSYLWLTIYVFMALIFFERGLNKGNCEKEKLITEQKDLIKRKAVALKSRRELEEIIASQNDPEWIEQTLMNVLGLVPQGYKKVIFVDH